MSTQQQNPKFTSFPVAPCAVKTFNHETKQWETQHQLPTRGNATQEQEEQNRRRHNQQRPSVPNNNGTRLRFLTFNVLADSFPAVVELAINSPLRFQHLPRYLAREKSTVYGLNEMTRNSLKAICDCEYFQKSGYSCIYYDDLVDGKQDVRAAVEYPPLSKAESKMLRSHGCALFIKDDLEVVDAFRIHLSAACAPVAAILRIPPKTTEDAEAQRNSNQQTLIGVIALHTSAYADEANRIARRNQLAGAKKVMEEMLTRTRQRLELNDLSDFEKDKRDLVVIMGDLNLHDINEEQTLLDLDLIDAWGETQFSIPANDGSVETAFNEKYIKSFSLMTKRIGLDKVYRAATSPTATEEEKQLQKKLFIHLLQASNVFAHGCTFNAVWNPMIPHYIPGETRQMRLDRITVRSGCKAYFEGQTRVVFQETLPNFDKVTLSDHYGLVQDLVVLDDDTLDSRKLVDTDIPAVITTGIVNRSAPPAIIGGDGDEADEVTRNARRLVGSPIVRRVREHLAGLPKDVTGVWPGFGGAVMKGLSWAAHPFFLAGRALNLV